MALALGIDVSDLINLVGNSKTQTARNIINSKLTADQKVTMTSTDFPMAWRTAIHSKIFVYCCS